MVEIDMKKITSVSPFPEQVVSKFNGKSKQILDLENSSNSDNQISPRVKDLTPKGFLDDFKLHKKTNLKNGRQVKAKQRATRNNQQTIATEPSIIVHNTKKDIQSI